MRTLLICQHDAPLDREGLARWLNSFSTLTGVVVVAEPAGRLRNRIAREVRRVGWLRFVDVVAFRAYYAVRMATQDREWERAALDRIRTGYPQNPNTSELIIGSPNSAETEAFIRASQPDMVIARCKTLLTERIFSLPPLGTFVMHPGICPEYRNAHGCFWARARGDYDNIGMTLLRIDRGVDTGPVIGYFRIRPDSHESHVVTQHRAVLEHLDGIRDSLVDVAAGRARSIDTTGRRSAAWGQPWLSAYVAMHRRTRHPDRSAEGLALQQKP
jgi:folate-dependent phosphoribosylglycinamide formyltransferase PurN